MYAAKRQLPTLDHLVFKLPPAQLPLTANPFAPHLDLQVGGKHADGVTENVLAVLTDGVYLEFLSFVEGAEHAQDHKWAPHAPGWVDFAMLGLGEATRVSLDSDPLNNGSYTYTASPTPGSRITPAGERLEWALSTPVFRNGVEGRPGSIPFFCHDVTPRQRRAGLGVDVILVLVKKGNGLKFRVLYSHIMNHRGDGDANSTWSNFKFLKPNGGMGTLMIREATSPEAAKWVEANGEGIAEVVVSHIDGLAVIGTDGKWTAVQTPSENVAQEAS